ncbi:TetR/AcrR family transcriptional regulator [Ammonicoccus fulvus]|uniref:TetR/AcrR family transcriptional regulator n=1 Tax=Ammonicoccus fulvus TaxID=3138240 RepID=A0ABZ3FN83_9ACTN
MAARTPLSRPRIIEAAAAVADRSGVEGVSMRTVAKELGVEAMSLYHHLAGKEQLLDDLANWVFEQIEDPDPGEGWRPALSARAHCARAVLGAHPWALRLVDARRAALPAQLRHHDATLGCLFVNGFSVELATHAVSVTDSYVYGFVLTEKNLPFQPGESTEHMVDDMELPLEDYPNLARMLGELVVGRDYRYASEFDFGLDVILDGLARHVGR